MVRVNLQRSILVYLGWLAFVSAALLLVLADLVPVVPAFVRPDSLFFYLVQAELFFVLVLWPIFIPKTLEEDKGGKPHILMMQVVVLFVFVLPLALICQNISNLDLWTFFKGQLLVAVLASFVAALFSLGVGRGWKISTFYYLGFFVLAAGLPFLYYLVLEFGGSSWGFLAVLSPFWAAGRVDASPAALVQCAIFGSAAVGLLLGPAFLRRTRSTAA